MSSIHINTHGAAKIIGLLSPLSSYHAKKLGIPFEKVGRQVIFNRKAVEQWYAEHPDWRQRWPRRHKHHHVNGNDQNVATVAAKLNALERKVDALIAIWEPKK